MNIDLDDLVSAALKLAAAMSALAMVAAVSGLVALIWRLALGGFCQ